MVITENHDDDENYRCDNDMKTVVIMMMGNGFLMIQ